MGLKYNKLHLYRYLEKRYSCIMKTFVFIAFLIGFTFQISAQEGTITIAQDQRIEELLKLYSEVNSKSGFYQIQVGFGDYQKAQNLKAQVDIDFPGWYSKIQFESPTYRVRLGLYRTKLQAERQFLRVRKKYPEAILLEPDRK